MMLTVKKGVQHSRNTPAYHMHTCACQYDFLTNARMEVNIYTGSPKNVHLYFCNNSFEKQSIVIILAI